MNKEHGSPYDRGGADSYYRRPRRPHKRPSFGEDITLLTMEELVEYNQGFDDNEERGDFKDWR